VTNPQQRKRKIKRELLKKQKIAKRPYLASVERECQEHYDEIKRIQQEEESRFLKYWKSVELEIIAQLEKEFQDWDSPEQEATQRRCRIAA